MTNRRQNPLTMILIPLALLATTGAAAQENRLELKSGDHICYIGNTLADRMQHFGWLETLLQTTHSDLNLSFRNLGFAGDEIKNRPRSQNFGTPDQWLTKCKADVIFCFFGYNESLRGPERLKQFEADLAEMLKSMNAQKYNGKSAPRIVVFSPIAHEDLKSPHLPSGDANNKRLRRYTEAMREVCRSAKVPFVDLFNPTLRAYALEGGPWTMNGIHLNDSGNKLVAEITMKQLFSGSKWTMNDQLKKLNGAVRDKNYHWFSRYRTVDGYNVFGGRSKLAWFGQSNADVMAVEMKAFDVMTANRDKRIWAIAKGGDLKVTDDNLPKQLNVKTNKPGKLAGGAYPYLGGKEAIEKMSVHEGFEINLFASEEKFPELANPVQMAVDPDGRLFVSVWPSYPHWNPAEPRKDRIIILPDEDGDGVADKCTIFADGLNSITGFEFWGGGIIVCSPPEIWFLKDTDGDDKADLKIRMLQGVSSADTHHTANAFVIGTDGWLYWSRGVFHVTNMETPTKTFRSTKSGVYRFNPRTFEVEFHFPIGPNPHGHVIDQWGFQFVNDGTGGTGSYVNIGKGIGNKKWFKKRWRPVPATGLLSSSHFPKKYDGNFLICNVIGFLGISMFEVKYNGADITAEEVKPLLSSTDPNFRPSDLEIGGDGALYVADWHNALIGHMQHNMRDPNRDHTHGRIYRMTYKGRPTVKPVKLRGKPIEQVLKAFYAKENTTRYRARLELSGRDSKQIADKVARWVSRLDPQIEDQAQAMLECLWVFEEHRIPNLSLLKKVFQANDGRVRAAAIRTLGHWSGRVKGWEPLLLAAASDKSGLVRAEAVKAAVEFEGMTAAEVVFKVATQPLDAELSTVLKYAQNNLKVDTIVRDLVASGKPLSQAAKKYVLKNASVNDLLKLERTEAVYEAILERRRVPPKQLYASLSGLAKMRGVGELKLLMDLLKARGSQTGETNLDELATLLASQPAAQLKRVTPQLKQLALNGPSASVRQAGFSAWIAGDQSGDAAYQVAIENKSRLKDFLRAVAKVPDANVRASMFEKIHAMLFELPGNLKSEASAGVNQPGIRVDYFEPHSADAAIETLAKRKPTASGVVADIRMNVPQLKRRDQFALRFTGNIRIERAGRYRFFTNSDDGSRLYVDGQLVVNNDGPHGMKEVRGNIKLAAGTHSIVVTYFDQGGGDGLIVSWAGPGIRKSRIPASVLSVPGSNTLHDIAIETLDTIPAQEKKKSASLAKLILGNKHRTTAVRSLLKISSKNWDSGQALPLAEALAKMIGKIPARERTGKSALEAMELTDKLAAQLPPKQASRFRTILADLKINVIRVGTVRERMIYDKEKIVVQAGKPVEFIFTNTDSMPHNFVIVQPGALEEVGTLAENTAQEKAAQRRQFVPRSDKILLSSRLLQPKENQVLSFEVPKQPGIYPYVCTYPGHWRRMYGALYVVADYKAYSADPAGYLAKAKLPMKDELLKYLDRNTEWTFGDLKPILKSIAVGSHDHSGDHKNVQVGHGRSFEVAQNLFKIANCNSCHKMNGVGREFGPDLTKLNPDRYSPEKILQSLIDPSKEIDKKYQQQTLELETGEIISGLIVKETADEIHIVENPILDPNPKKIKKKDVFDRAKSKVSTMPKGLLNKFSEEEIIDIIAFIYAKGDKKHKLFQKHDHKK